MKKRLIPLLAACLLLTGCSSLPTAREMGDMALMRTMGIDTVPDGVRVTGSTGPRARGLEAEGEPSLVLTAERPSLSGACLAMQGQSDSFVFFGYVDQLLIGEELASEGVSPVLDYFAQDVELGLGAQLWLVRGTTAQEAVSSGGDEGIDQRLETLQHDGKMGIASISRTAGETYVDLMELGSAFVPALSPAGNETGVLLESGYGIIKDGALAGFLDGEAAKGLELLAGGGAADILDIELADNKVSAKITSAHTQSAFEFQGDTLSALKLTCEVEVRVTEYQRRLSDEERNALQGELERRERERLGLALERLRAWRADCAGLGVGAAMAHPAKWQTLQADWPDWFAKVPVEIRVRVTIQE